MPEKRYKARSQPNVLDFAARGHSMFGTLKGVGWVYRQTFVDTYAKAGCAKVHDGKTPIMAADLRNGLVLPFPAENGAVPRRVLSGRGAE